MIVLSLLLLVKCTGEIFSSWVIEWKIKTNKPIDFSELTFSFEVEMEKVQFFKSKLETTGRLTQSINIVGYNHDQVFKINPNLHFYLQNDSIIILDTTFTWSEMQFVNSTSVKEIVIKN